MRRLGGLIAAATLCLVAAPATEAAIPPVGSAGGVTAVNSHGKLVFVFTSKAWKRTSGRQVSLDCLQTPPVGPGSPPAEVSGETIKAPKTGRKLKTRLRAGRYDVC